ncbi:protein phosphatase 4 regulatory subunit 1 [Reticulomyxa filosa]|uniref:Protein phosphatase 4 regulatory subunit 1 n=1 Tax=Reticulomyxa filosa TaxID=46433 RepID=X6NFZ4_RETFI|nr:protein phosphatase 4 regulatory subunit 1 [Reticulomyxa filosa]|eukprot:ETO25250.1 protein phosphatase 4 regulatory subunit 1 [Reticulomyxa filosa]
MIKKKLVAVKRLASACTLFGSKAAFSLLTHIRNVASDKEMVIRQTCAEQLGVYSKYLIEATKDSKEAHELIINDLLPLLKEMLRDAMEVRQAAGASLILIAELLTKEEVYDNVLKIVLHMAHDDTDDQKITALPVYLLAELAPIVGYSICKNYLSLDLHALSQDNSFRVRKVTVQYFGPICEQLGADDAEKTLVCTLTDILWSNGPFELFLFNFYKKIILTNSFLSLKRFAKIPFGAYEKDVLKAL